MKHFLILVFLFFYPFLNSYARPPYDGTIFYFPDVINSSDPSTFEELIYTGQDLRKIFDRRKGGRWLTKEVFLFNASNEEIIKIIAT